LDDLLEVVSMFCGFRGGEPRAAPVAIAGLILIAALGSGPAVSAAERHVTVTLTEHGIPHVVARDWNGLGYGEGYALARNDLCSIANAIATYSGRRAQRYGMAGAFMAFAGDRAPVPNAQEDLVQRFLIDDEVVKRARAKMSSRARALVDGFAAGYNAYVAALPPTKRPEACRGEGVIQAITGDDVIRRIYAFAILDGAEAYRSELLAAAPPSPERKAEAPPFAGPRSALGSNALAIGRDLTVNGSGLLLANPHFFWDGPDHFVEVHLTIPGRLDAMGAALNAHPAILIGFNQSLAWTRTTSTDAHAAFYRLKLDPADPTRYLVDGRSIPMRRCPITVPSRDENGRPGVAQHVFWTTRFGPVVASALMSWSRNEAYALADPNRLNIRALDEDLQIASTHRVEPLRASLRKSVGSGFYNTFAADAAGKTLFAAMAPVLAFDAAKYSACRSEAAMAPWWAPPVFDGSRSDCEPTRYRDAPDRWVLPGLMKPSLIRTDYVANSNDSYWLTNAHQPLEGFSPIMGRERAPQRERQRTGHLMVRERISGADGLPGNRFDGKTLETLLFQNRNLTADLVIDDLVAACRRTPVVEMADGARFDLSHACDVLGLWDRRQDLGSVGAALFREFAYRALADGIYPDRFWKTPFDLKDPVGTPRSLTDDPATVQAILRSLAKALAGLGKVGIPIDASLGQVQFVERNGRRIPLHGGPTMTSYNAMDDELIANLGYTHPSAATSYVQVVGFGPHGPEADAILANSQSSDPASPFYADQTEMYSQKQWFRLPFTREDVAAHAIAPPLVLRVSP
jgi:acyl-homoserine-lactone acylase